MQVQAVRTLWPNLLKKCKMATLNLLPSLSAVPPRGRGASTSNLSNKYNPISVSPLKKWVCFLRPHCSSWVLISFGSTQQSNWNNQYLITKILLYSFEWWPPELLLVVWRGKVQRSTILWDVHLHLREKQMQRDLTLLQVDEKIDDNILNTISRHFMTLQGTWNQEAKVWEINVLRENLQNPLVHSP